MSFKLKESNVLGVEARVYEDCGYCKKQSSEILRIPWEHISQWLWIMQQMGSKEWGAVFNVEGNRIIDWKIPLQEVTSTEVEFKEENGYNGMVHSHHSMNLNGFSGQDDRQARNLYEWNIVLSATGYVACRKVKLPCAGFSYTEVKLEIEDCPTIDLSKIQDKKIYPRLVPVYKGRFEDQDYPYLAGMGDHPEENMFTKCWVCGSVFADEESIDGRCPYCTNPIREWR